MNITLTLEPEIEKGLLARAQERGLTLGVYLKDLVKKEAGLAIGTQRSGKEKAQAFIAWAKGHHPTELLSEDAIGRATLYADRP